MRRSLLALLAGLLTLSACSQPSHSAGSDGEVTVSPQVQKARDAYYKGTFTAPPSETVKTAKGKVVWLIDCGADQPSCSVPSGYAADAAKALGWTTKEVDGKSNPSTQSTLIRQAIAAGADGVILQVIDCVNVKQALVEARDAGVKIVAHAGADCPHPLFDYAPSISGAENYLEGETVSGDAQAAWIASRLGSEGGKVIGLRAPFVPAGEKIWEGFVAGMKKYCPKCEVVEMTTAITDFGGTALSQKVQATLTKNPDAKAFMGLFDGAVSLGVAPGLKAAGRSMPVTGAQGSPDMINRIRTSDGAFATVATSEVAAGYEAIDALNSLFQGEEPAPSSNGWQLVDESHNVPDGDEYIAPYNYAAAYKARWGVK
jgi:ribose transport system substrate-binding protein